MNISIRINSTSISKLVDLYWQAPGVTSQIQSNVQHTQLIVC